MALALSPLCGDFSPVEQETALRGGHGGLKPEQAAQAAGSGVGGQEATATLPWTNTRSVTPTHLPGRAAVVCLAQRSARNSPSIGGVAEAAILLAEEEAYYARVRGEAVNALDNSPELTILSQAFEAVFHPKMVQVFGSESLRVTGFCDGNRGVQWNIWVEIPSRTVYVGVNLEGMKYDGWPIGRLIEREVSEPCLTKLVAKTERPNEITVWWRKDVWRAGVRLPNFAEHEILRCRLSEVTEGIWTRAVEKARDCLNGDLAGRGKVKVTLMDGTEKPLEVSPHLQFYRSVGTLQQGGGSGREDGSWSAALRAARDQLSPLYEFVRERSGR